MTWFFAPSSWIHIWLRFQHWPSLCNFCSIHNFFHISSGSDKKAKAACALMYGNDLFRCAGNFNIVITHSYWCLHKRHSVERPGFHDEGRSRRLSAWQRNRTQRWQPDSQNGGAAMASWSPPRIRWLHWGNRTATGMLTWLVLTIRRNVIFNLPYS